MAALEPGVPPAPPHAAQRGVTGRLAVLSTVASVLVSAASAYAIVDRVPAVEVTTLFFGGVATGASVATLVAQRRGAHCNTRASEGGSMTSPHPPPSEPRAARPRDPPVRQQRDAPNE
jgi:hypothetical protein